MIVLKTWNLNFPTLEAYQKHIKHLLYSFFLLDSRLPRSRALRKRSSSLPWWNETCQAAVNERKNNTHAYLRCPSFDKFISYKGRAVRNFLKSRFVGWCGDGGGVEWTLKAWLTGWVKLEGFPQKIWKGLFGFCTMILLQVYISLFVIWR